MKKTYRCHDGFCGADDCQRCRPNTYHLDEAYEDECTLADDAHNNGDEDE